MLCINIYKCNDCKKKFKTMMTMFGNFYVSGYSKLSIISKELPMEDMCPLLTPTCRFCKSSNVKFINSERV